MLSFNCLKLFFFSFLQGEGWIYNKPLWKSTWQQKQLSLALLADDNWTPASPPLMGAGGRAKGALTSRDTPTRAKDSPEWHTHKQEKNKQGAKGIPTVRAKMVVGALGTKYIFYIQLIVLLFKVEYFYFSPCKGLFCTRTVWSLPLVFCFVSVLFLRSMFFPQTLSIFGSRLLVRKAALEWIDTP